MPTLPTNIKIIMTTFPIPDRCSVSPRDIPQVPNADVISKRICINVACGSDNDKIIVAKTTKKVDKIMTT